MANINIAVSGLPNTGKSTIIAEIVSHLKTLGLGVTFQDQCGETCIDNHCEHPEHRTHCLEHLVSRGVTIHLREITTMQPQQPVVATNPDWYWVKTSAIASGRELTYRGYALTYKDGVRYRSNVPIDGNMLEPDPFSDDRWRHI